MNISKEGVCYRWNEYERANRYKSRSLEYRYIHTGRSNAIVSAPANVLDAYYKARNQRLRENYFWTMFVLGHDKQGYDKQSDVGAFWRKWVECGVDSMAFVNCGAVAYGKATGDGFLWEKSTSRQRRDKYDGVESAIKKLKLELEGTPLGEYSIFELLPDQDRQKLLSLIGVGDSVVSFELAYQQGLIGKVSIPSFLDAVAECCQMDAGDGVRVRSGNGGKVVDDLIALESKEAKTIETKARAFIKLLHEQLLPMIARMSVNQYRPYVYAGAIARAVNLLFGVSFLADEIEGLIKKPLKT